MADRSIKVTLRADVRDFKSQFDQASQAADRVGKSTEDAATKSKGVFGELKQSAQDNRQAWTTAGTALTGFGAAILGVGAMAASTGVAYNQLQQRAGSALEVLMGSAEGAAEQMARLNEFADTSPFSREIFIEAQQQLIAFGIEADRVVPILSAVQDAVAATGGSNADIAELVNIIAKVGSTGKITAQNLNELGYRGVDAATIIGEQMGKTGEEIRSEITAGTLDADAALQALTDGMTEKFGGAAAGMKETFDGAIDRLKAAWRDLSADLMAPLVSPDGGGFLVDLTNRAADALRVIESMPGPVKTAGAALAGLTGAASLGAGAFLLLLPRALDTIDAFNTLRRDLPKTVGALKDLGKTAGIAAAALIGLNVISSITEGARDSAADVELFESSLRNLHRTGEITTGAVNDLASSTVPFGVSVRGIGDALDLIDPDPVSAALEGLTNIVLGVPTTADVASESLGALDDALSGLASDGSLSELSSAFQAAVQDAEEYGYTAEDLIANLPGLSSVLTDIATDMGLQADEATLLKLATGELKPVFDEATGAVSGYADGAHDAAAASQAAADAADEALSAMRELADEFIGAERGVLNYADALDSATDTLKENGEAWGDDTEAARENKGALLDVAEQAWATADALSADNKSGTFLRDAHADLVDLAIQAGMSEEAAKSYADQLLMTPEEIQTIIDLDAESAQAKWDAIFAELWPEGGHPPMVIDPEVDPDGKVPEFTGLLSDIPPEVTTGVDAETDEATGRVWSFDGVLEDATEDRTANVGADVEPAIWEVNRFNTVVDESGGTVEINGQTLPADAALSTLLDIINGSDGTVTIDGMTVPADQALSTIIGIIDSSEGTVTIEGDNDPANRATDAAKSRADGTTGTMDIDGDRGPADGKIDGAKSKADRTTGRITVNADTSSANSAISNAARPRTSWISVSMRKVGNWAAGLSGGGWVNPGLNSGGWVPGPYPGPGVDNTVWPVRSGAAGGKSLDMQPLAGTEFVVNGRSARQWGPMLEAINSGMSPDQVAPVHAAPVHQSAGAQQSAAPSVLTLDGAALGAISEAVRTGASQARIGVSPRDQAQFYQGGRSASRAFGGAR